MEHKKEAVELAETIVKVANQAKTKTIAIVTDMNQVLGRNVGNALEVQEAVEFLKGQNVDTRLYEITMELCGEALVLSKLAKNLTQAKEKLEQALKSGRALQKFQEIPMLLPLYFSSRTSSDRPASRLPSIPLVSLPLP